MYPEQSEITTTKKKDTFCVTSDPHGDDDEI